MTLDLVPDSPLADVGGVGLQPVDGQESLRVPLPRWLSLNLENFMKIKLIFQSLFVFHLAARQFQSCVGIEIVPA